MSRKLVARLLAGLAVFFLAAGVSNTAHAYFMVLYECATGVPEWGGSTNWINVHVKINNVWNFVSRRILQLPNCVTWGEGFGFEPWSASDVQAIRLSTEGSDAFWVDRVGLQDASGNMVVTWGQDDFIGYCLSRDPDDGNNSWCWNNTAYSRIDFNR